MNKLFSFPLTLLLTILLSETANAAEQLQKQTAAQSLVHRQWSDWSPFEKADSKTGPLPGLTFAERAKQTSLQVPFEATGTLDDEDATFGDGSPYERHTFTGQAGKIVKISLTSGAFDTQLFLVDADNQPLADNDDSNNSTDSELVVRLPETGTYAVLATTYDPDGRGRYGIKATAGTETEAKAFEAERLNRAGLASSRQARYSDALELFEQALAIHREINDRGGEGTILNNIGGTYSDLGQYPQALDYHEQALVIFSEIDNQSSKGIVLNNIGLAYDNLGQYPQALDYYEQSLMIHREISDRSGEGGTLNNIGVTYDNLGQYPQALDYYEQALMISREIDDLAGEGRTLNNIGGTYRNLGQYPQALDYYEQALMISRKIGNRAGEGTTLNNIGLAYGNLGQYPQALDYYEQSLVILREIGNRANEGRTLNNIGLTYDKLGQYSQALDYYEQALVISRKIGNRAGEGGTLSNIGVVYRRLGQYPQALDYYEQSLVILREIGHRAGEGDILNNVGLTYNRLEQYLQALEYYERALVISREIGDRAGEGTTLNNIGWLLETTDEPELAIIFLKQSVNVYETIRKENLALSSEQQQSYTDTVADTYRKLADLLLQQDRILEAQAILDLLKVQELDDYLNTVRGNARTASGVEYLRPEEAILEKYQAIQKNAIQVGQTIAQLLEKDRTEGLNSTEAAELTELYTIQTEIGQQLTDFAISPDIVDLIAQLSTDIQDQTIKITQLEGIRDKLDNFNAALIYPLILDDRIELVITVPNSKPLRRTVENVPRDQLNETIRALRAALQNPYSDAQTPAHQLYQWLIEPLEDDLATANVDTLIYAPDGNLRYIPLAALHDGETWLVERFSINNITAASLEDWATQPVSTPRILAGAFADTETSHPIIVNNRQVHFAGLPFAGTEVELLSDLMPDVVTYVDEAFSLTSLEPRLNGFNILHFATHAALVPGDASESFILSGDGKPTTLRDIAQWTLNEVDLVILSACETGLGGFDNNGEQVLGLGYQFQDRGARSVMASLWQVDDGGTQALMNAFYQALKAGHPKAKALKLAQQVLIQADLTLVGAPRGTSLAVIDRRTNQPIRFKGSLSHPYYWAPFILIGNGL